MNKMKSVLTALFLALFVVGFSSAADVDSKSGERGTKEPVADVSISPGGITWNPNMDYKQLVLTISGPNDTYVRKTFESGSSPYFDLSDANGTAFPDGSYTYELRVTAIFQGHEEGRTRNTPTQTGYFLVRGGCIVTPTCQQEFSRVMDIQHPVDVIIPNHLCTGSGCSKGMNFGDNRIVVNAPTPWIYFDDTDASDNDWRIIINNETCGAGLFSIEDTDAAKRLLTLEAGAPENSIYVDDDGKIGFGTAAPAAKIDIRSGSTIPSLSITSDSSSPALVTADRTNGATVQISAGVKSTYIGSRSNHNMHLIVNQYEKVTIKTNGYVGIGDKTPSYPLDVGSANGAHVTAGGVWTNGSSREYKENIAALDLNAAIKTLNDLKPVTFNYKNEKNEEYAGFIAEDVPQLVAQNNRKNLSAMDIVAVLTRVVQEQQKTISELKKEVQELKKK
jgi:hypothetical protein